jgi:hypothetical protein
VEATNTLENGMNAHGIKLIVLKGLKENKFYIKVIFNEDIL